MGRTESRWVGGGLGGLSSGAVGRTAGAVPQVRCSGPQLRTYMGEGPRFMWEGSWGVDDVLATACSTNINPFVVLVAVHFVIRLRQRGLSADCLQTQTLVPTNYDEASPLNLFLSELIAVR